MKKLSLLLLAITIAASSFAQSSTMELVTVKKIKTDEIITSLKVYNNVEVILTSDSINIIQVAGQKADVENTQVNISNGVLTIRNTSEGCGAEKVVILIPAREVNSINIHGASTVSSTGILSNEILDITINGEGKANIKSSGNIRMNTVADLPMDSVCR